jgi:TPR repeat protein
LKTLEDIKKKYGIGFNSYEMDYIDLILEMYNNPNLEPEKYDLNNDLILNFIGQYFHVINININLAKKYYLMAIDKNNNDSIESLGILFKSEKDYESMKKYYLMAIEKGNDKAMYYLGSYYKNVEKDFGLMKKYYQMAIEKGNYNAMYNLGYYYQFEEKDYELMKKYYQMAIENGCDNSLEKIKSYYNKDYTEYYNFLKNIIDKNKIIIDEINNLKLLHTQLIYT